MGIASAAELIFSARGDTDDARKEFKKFQAEVKDLKSEVKDTDGALAKLGHNAGLSANQFSSLSTVVTGVAVGAAALVAATAAAGAALFNLTKSTAEYGSAIFDATQKTGLGAETMSALKVAAEQSGSSFEGVTNAVAKFNVLIGNAATGNDKAEKILKQYGITSTDTQGALEQAITKIAGMGSASEQAAAAGALFKDRTGEILPVIKSFDGDLPGLIRKLREMGLLMSDENAKAADEFGDQMDTLNTQLAQVGRTIGFALMPVFNDMAKDMSSWISTNQGEIKAWSNTFADSFAAVVTMIKKANKEMKEWRALQQAGSAFEGPKLDSTGNITNSPGFLSGGGGLLGGWFSIEQEKARQHREGSKWKFGYGTMSGPANDKKPAAYAGDGGGKPAKSVKEKLPKFDFTGEMRDYQKALRNLPADLRAQIIEYAGKYGIPTGLAFAQLFSESSFNTKVSSNQNAHGLGQLQPATASKALGRKVSKADLFDVDTNLSAWGAEMSRLFKKYGDWALAALAYHGGDGTADAFLKAQAGGEESLARFAKGNPKSARYAQKIPELGRLSKDELIGAVDIEKELEKQKALDEKRAKEAIQLARATMAEKLEIFESGQKKLAAFAEEAFAAGEMSAKGLAETQEILEAQTLEERKRLLNEYIEKLKTVGPEGIEEIHKAELKLKLLEDEIESDRAENFVKQRARWDAEAKADADKAIRAQEEWEKEQEREEARRAAEIHPEPRAPLLNPQAGDPFAGTEGQSPFDVLTQGMEKAAGLPGLANIISSSFNQMAQAVGASVKAFVLFGGSGTNFRKFAAEMLASLASMAAVQALWELAQGFAMLALAYFGIHPTAGLSAGQHFIAAGVYGAIAGVAAVAGRAVAGNSFNKQTQGGYGSAGQSSGSSGGSRNSSGQGQNYSGYGDDVTIIDSSINQATPMAHVTLQIVSNDSHIIDVIERDVNHNGKLRTVIQDAT